MHIFIYGVWLLWTCFIVQNAQQQNNEEQAIQEMKNFKETPHRLRIGDIKEK